VNLALCGAAFVGAGISAVLGMAGGMLLLAVMLLVLDPIEAIPIHALVQMASNASRSAIHARHVKTRILLPYALLLVPAGLLTLPLAQQLPPHLLKLGIWVFVLVATWRPSWLLLGFSPERIPIGPRFAGLGALAGAAGVLVGATGPLIAPFFLGLGLNRYELIGTKAACQMLGHGAKLLIFGLAGFAFREHAGLMIGMSIGVIAGTWCGTQLLRRISESRFVQLYRGILTLLALRLVASGWLAS